MGVATGTEGLIVETTLDRSVQAHTAAIVEQLIALARRRR